MDALRTRLEKNGFTVSVFETAAEAADYLNRAIHGVTVGCGVSMTLQEMGLYESLTAHNRLHYHLTSPTREETRLLAASTEVYLLSANGIAADTGEIINIDGVGNRVASSLFGHRKVYLVAGRNKISPDFASALHRVRHVVSPKNARRMGLSTPCAAKADRCYDCDSPERICNGLTVLYRKMKSMDMEVVLINEPLGY